MHIHWLVYKVAALEDLLIIIMKRMLIAGYVDDHIRQQQLNGIHCSNYPN